MEKNLKIGSFELFWLKGGIFELDGGAMFGVVPKILWSKKYPPSNSNHITLTSYPILVKTPGKLILIESGLGNKFTEKQRQTFRLKQEWDIINDLKEMNISPEDIDIVALTHFDFDHAGGVVMQREDNTLNLTFPNARHIIQRAEWEDVLNPNKRSINTYWQVNYEKLKESPNLDLIEGSLEIADGISVIHTGGHNRGHQIIRMESGNEVALHLADLLPTHAHFNPLWVMAYDNFPLDAIFLKERLISDGVKENAWFTFYHDAHYLACKFDEKGNVTEKIEMPS